MLNTIKLLRDEQNKFMDDTVLLKNFEILVGNNQVYKGKSMSVCQSTQNRWKQAKIDNNGGYFNFTGSPIDIPVLI